MKSEGDATKEALRTRPSRVPKRKARFSRRQCGDLINRGVTGIIKSNGVADDGRLVIIAR